MTAADVVGRYLIAREDVPVYDIPNGTRIGEIKKGNSTAEVFSWVEKDGQVWWAFDYTIPGQSPSSYYVLHKPGRFSLSAAAGNVIVSPSALSPVDVFPAISKNMLIYGALGLAALLIITRR